MKPGSQMKGLKEFEADPDLAHLEQMLGEFDAFAFLGVSRSEETHSNILAWLPSQNEGGHRRTDPRHRLV